MSESRTFGTSTITLVVGDITELEVDAVVNAANADLAGGGGVDGAIHRRGGPSIMEETRRLYPRGCPTGEAVLSGGGDLPARWVVHAVGPIYRGGDHGEEAALRGAYRRSLEVAREAGARRVAFPAISAGVYGYPLAEAASVAVSEVARVVGETPDPPVDVTFCLFSEPIHAAFSEALAAL